MAFLIDWRKVLIVGFAISSLAGAAERGSFEDKLDRSWKKYHNTAYGYCVSYPSRWLRGEAFEGAGLFVETGVKKFSRPVGEIDFVAIEPAKESSDARMMPVSLKDNWQDHLTVLQKFERAERMQILEQRELQVQGSAALFTKQKYYDPQDRATWIDEVLFVNRQGRVYRLEMECLAEQIERFAPVFEYLMGTLEFDCSN